VTDPVGVGVVATLSRPGGNITGLANQISDTAGKKLEFLREIVPDLRRLAIMANVGNPGSVMDMREAQAAARTLGLMVTTSEIRRAEDIAPAFETRGCNLCFSRPAGKHQSDSHQHFGGAIADYARHPGVR
jgi:putative ABC transport system substrate-binding protein